AWLASLATGTAAAPRCPDSGRALPGVSPVLVYASGLQLRPRIWPPPDPDRVASRHAEDIWPAHRLPEHLWPGAFAPMPACRHCPAPPLRERSWQGSPEFPETLHLPHG